MNGFEIRTLPGKGKSMIAIKSFKKDDIIFEEEPFVSCQYSWNKAYQYAACDHCMRPLETAEENARRLANDQTIVLPLLEFCPTKQWQKEFTSCESCGIRYCSDDCKIEARKKYHNVACMGPFKDDVTHPINILEEKWKLMHYPPEAGTIMLLVRLLAMYIQSKDKVEFLNTLKSFQNIIVNEELMICHKILGSNFETRVNELQQAFKNAFPSEDLAIFTDLENFQSLMVLVGTNSQGIATSPIGKWGSKAVQANLSPNQQKQIDEFIDNLYEKLHEYSGEFLNNEGSGLYILQSKMNHSCTPNAVSTFPYNNDIVVMKALKDIQYGEEICISYLEECQLERSRHSRQKHLKENYLFVCTCPKCELQKIDPDVTSEEEIDDDEDIDEDNDVDMDLA